MKEDKNEIISETMEDFFDTNGLKLVEQRKNLAIVTLVE